MTVPDGDSRQPDPNHGQDANPPVGPNANTVADPSATPTANTVDQRSNAKVLYPGSFDPIHLGHVDVIEQAAALFGQVVVVAMHNPSKPGGLFSVDQRVAMITASIAHVRGARVERFGGLAIDAATEHGVAFIVKGVRNAGDFEIEQQMAHTNHSVSGIRTVFLPCRPSQAFVSSRFIREIAKYGGDVSHLVPGPVSEELLRMFAPGSVTTPQCIPPSPAPLIQPSEGTP